MSKRLDSLRAILLTGTVLEEWFRPMQQALEPVYDFPVAYSFE
jgi:hypothetical protein